MNGTNYTTLMAHLTDVPDPRGKQGRQYEWVFILTVLCGALISGSRSVRGMAQWAWLHMEEIVAAVKPVRLKVPSASTLYRALRKVDITELEGRISAYIAELDAADRVTGEVQGRDGAGLRGQSIDGKEVRMASKQGAPLMLVSLVRHESGAVLAQKAVSRKTNEITVAPALLAGRDLTGTVTTMDALLTQREIAQQIVEQGGDYLMVVKGNQPSLHEAISLLFESPPVPARAKEVLRYTYTTGDHGRIDRRTLESSTALNHYLDWPGVAQVLRRTRRSRQVTTDERSEHVTYGITSLARQRALPEQIESLWRAHWTIENRLHYVRDESMGEDRSTLRSDNAPHAMAALRNAILALLRFEGWSNIPDGFRFFNASVHKSLIAIGALET